VNYLVSFRFLLVFDPFSLKRPYLGISFADCNIPLKIISNFAFGNFSCASEELRGILVFCAGDI